MENRKHNGIISLWKFIFSLVIMIYHTNTFFPDNKIPIFKGGYIGVEFFFLVSGFFLAKKSLSGEYNKKEIGIETFKYIWNKIKSFFPYILVSVIGATIILLIFDENFKIHDLVNDIWNILLLKQFGFRAPYTINTLWYLSVMLISILILYPLVKKYKENFIILISPLIVIFSLGYLNHIQLSISHYYSVWKGFFYTGTLRGFAEMNLGMILYLTHLNLKDIQYTKFGKTILTIVSHFMLIVILCTITFVNTPKRYDYVMLLMIAVAILIMSSEKTYEYKTLSNKYVFYLERLSLPIFINHPFIITIERWVPSIIQLAPMVRLIICVLTTIIFSIIEMIIINYLREKRNFNISKIFIKSRKVKKYV